jgi:hypothetical protein
MSAHLLTSNLRRLPSTVHAPPHPCNLTFCFMGFLFVSLFSRVNSSPFLPAVGVQAAMGGKEESEMRGLSVFFIASILPSLIKGVGDIYGDFNEEGRWVKKGPLSPEDARPYDVDKPLFREKSKAQTCPRDGLAGCAFVDHVHTVRPFASPPGACSLHAPAEGRLACRTTAVSTRAGRRSCSATRGATRSARSAAR